MEEEMGKVEKAYLVLLETPLFQVQNEEGNINGL
jgi:hypothetical protein